MNVGAYVKGKQSERLPLLDAKLFNKLKDAKGYVSGKILAVRTLDTPKFQGLGMDFKNGTAKFAFLTRYTGYDIQSIVNQLDSEETDDWLGQNVKFVTNKGSKGGIFVNVWNPRSNKNKKK